MHLATVRRKAALMQGGEHGSCIPATPPILRDGARISITSGGRDC